MMKNPQSNRPNAVAMRPSDQFLQSQPPVFKGFYLEEPKLVFANNEVSVDPKAGLEEYGPYGCVPGKTIKLGLIGTGRGIQAFRDFLQAAHRRLSAGFNKRSKPLDPHTFPDFPGCGPDHTFRAQFSADQASHQRVIAEELFAQALRAANDQDKIQRVVDLVVKQVEAMAALEDSPDVILLLMPRDVEDQVASIGVPLARQKTRLSPLQKLQRKLSKESLIKGQGFFTFDFGDQEPESTQTAFYNIHHALKAHTMKYGKATQLLWESTLNDPNLATIAWNIFTALYYKAGNSPWRLQTLPEQTCFVGVSFFKENPTAVADMQTSLAQIFGAGEGIVLRGEKAVVDKKRDRKAHLTENGAFNLLTKAIEQYKLQHSLPPKRVVVHKTSRYWPEEMKGFKRALGDIYHFDLLAIETRNIRFMRLGKRPPLRGTVIQLGERNYLLFGNGYIPYLRAYPGKRIPRPLEVVEHHGASTAQTVCEELLALTKLNWNSCAFGSSVPITIRFARDVGKILTELPAGSIPETKYKYYM